MPFLRCQASGLFTNTCQQALRAPYNRPTLVLSDSWSREKNLVHFHSHQTEYCEQANAEAGGGGPPLASGAATINGNASHDAQNAEGGEKRKRRNRWGTPAAPPKPAQEIPTGKSLHF